MSLTRAGGISRCSCLEKDQGTVRERDAELSQAVLIGASDSLTCHGWAWRLNSDLLPSMQTQNQIVYFIRQAPVPITPENFEATVQFGTVRGSYVPALLRLLSGVFAPQIFTNSTWPESIRNHFASHLHRFLACLTGECKGWSACFLPRPHRQASQRGRWEIEPSTCSAWRRVATRYVFVECVEQGTEFAFQSRQFSAEEQLARPAQSWKFPRGRVGYGELEGVRVS